ncbi:MAG: shikimate dehydrogenase [Paenisporosarcina sp.]
MKKWYAVIGDPISHSLSPQMHSKWFEALNMNATYIPIHVPKEQLHQSINALRLLGVSGWNVTIPHKETIIPLLDRLSESAKWMGAVNTVVVEKDGTLTGHNTDGEGFVSSLEEMVGHHLKELQVLIIGAGGAARGIAFSLKAAGYESISFTNRTLTTAEKLVKEVGGYKALTIQSAEESLNDFQLIIQTTPLGMKSAENILPISLDLLNPSAIVADIVYNPLLTPFLLQAEKKGAKIVNGLGMFVHQGALSFKMWTTEQPDTEQTVEELTRILGGPYVNR